MPNIAIVLKDEIRRLARREINRQMGSTRRLTSRYRSDIATLKRLVQVQQRKLAFLESRELQKSSDAAPAEAAPGARFSARSVRAQRKRLRLSAEQYAAIIGVSPQTIYLWERGKVRPKASQFAALIAARTLGRREVLARLEQADKKAVKKALRKTKPRRKKAKR